MSRFLNRMRWLNSSRARSYIKLLASMNIGFLIIYFLTSSGNQDLNGNTVGTDFLSFWVAGQMLHQHLDVYNISAHTMFQNNYFGDDGGYYAFFYPPPFLLWCWLLGGFAYLPALYIWLTTTSVACGFAARAWHNRLVSNLPYVLTFIAFPATLLTILHGQTAFLVATLLGLGLLWVRSRPWLAGAMFGMATIKPQLGLLIPIVLIMTGQWRAILAAICVSVVIIVATSMTFGFHVWSDWLSITDSAYRTFDSGAIAFSKFVSPFAAIKLLGVPTKVALAIHGVIALGVTAAIIKISFNRPLDLQLAAATLTGGILVTPFALDYDMMLLIFPLIFLGSAKLNVWEKLIVSLTFIAPMLVRPLATYLALPIGPVIIFSLFWVLIRRAIKDPLSEDLPSTRSHPRQSIAQHETLPTFQLTKRRIDHRFSAAFKKISGGKQHEICK